MKRFLLIVILLGYNFVHAQNHKTQKYISNQLKDLEILKNSLLYTTGNPYLYTDSVVFLALFDSAKTFLEQPRSLRDQFTVFSKLVAATNCGHTTIGPSKLLFRDFFSHLNNLIVPVQVYDHRLFAVSNYGSKVKIKKGDEILSINNKSVAEILEEMYALIPSDGYNATFKDFYLKDLFPFYYYITQKATNDHLIEFKHRTRIDTLRITNEFFDYRNYLNQLKGNPMLNSSQKVDFGEFQLKKSSGYAYFKFPSFYHLSGKKYFNYLDQCFERINQSEVPFVIIDVRGNLGGQPQTYLMSYFIDDAELITYGYGTIKPFENKKYITHKIDGKYHEYKKDFRKSKRSKLKNKTFTDFTSIPNFSGKVILLTDGGSFSASANLAANLKSKANCYIIGEETGGNENQGNTGNIVLKLPYSKFYITINPFYFNNCVNTSNDFGVYPDELVPVTFQLKTKNDPQMKAALNYIKKNKRSVIASMQK